MHCALKALGFTANLAYIFVFLIQEIFDGHDMNCLVFGHVTRLHVMISIFLGRVLESCYKRSFEAGGGELDL